MNEEELEMEREQERERVKTQRESEAREIYGRMGIAVAETRAKFRNIGQAQRPSRASYILVTRLSNNSAWDDSNA